MYNLVILFFFAGWLINYLGEHCLNIGNRPLPKRRRVDERVYQKELIYQSDLWYVGIALTSIGAGLVLVSPFSLIR